MKLIKSEVTELIYEFIGDTEIYVGRGAAQCEVNKYLNFRLNLVLLHCYRRMLPIDCLFARDHPLALLNTVVTLKYLNQDNNC